MEKDPTKHFKEGEIPIENSAIENLNILYDTMTNVRPDLENFKGNPGFPDWDIERDQSYVEKLDERFAQKTKDVFADSAEPIICFLLNTGVFSVENNRSFAFMASKYDDYVNKADIAFGVQQPNYGRTMFAIDVGTANNRGNLQEKLERHFEQPIHNLSLPAGFTKLKYCEAWGEKWSENRVLNLVVGVNPGNINKAIKNIRVDEGENIEIEETNNLEFKIASELLEESFLYENSDGDHDAKVLMGVMFRKLHKDLRITEISEFYVKYEERVNEFMRTDNTYRTIIEFAREKSKIRNTRAQARATGSGTLQGFNAQRNNGV